MQMFFFTYSSLICLSLFGFIGYVFAFFDPAQMASLSIEGGFIETGTVFLFAITSIIALARWSESPAKIILIFALLMICAAMREMDLHKQWTTDSILKSRFYLSPETPMIEKITGGLVILFLLYAAFCMARRIPQWIKNLLGFSATAWSIFLGLGFLTAGKMIDSMVRLFPFLSDFHQSNQAYLNVVEESFELAGAAFFILTAIYLVKSSRP